MRKFLAFIFLAFVFVIAMFVAMNASSADAQEYPVPSKYFPDKSKFVKPGDTTWLLAYYNNYRTGGYSPQHPGHGYDDLLSEDNNLLPEEAELRWEICRRDRFLQAMLYCGMSGYYPKHYRKGRGVSVWHKIESKSSPGDQYNGPYWTRDFSLVRVPKRLLKKHHAMFWSVVRKAADRSFVKAKYYFKARQKREQSVRFLAVTMTGNDVVEKMEAEERRNTLAFLKNKPSKLPGVPWADEGMAIIVE